MNRLFGLFLMFWLAIAPSTATATEPVAAVALKPAVLQALQRAGAAPKPATKGPSRSPLDAEGMIHFPAAIAFGADGCFAGYFPYRDLKQLKFDCIGGLDRLALAEVHPEASKQAKGSLVVLELIPSFAIGMCTECETISADLRELLKSRSIDAKIFRVDIGY